MDPKERVTGTFIYSQSISHGVQRRICIPGIAGMWADLGSEPYTYGSHIIQRIRQWGPVGIVLSGQEAPYTWSQNCVDCGGKRRGEEKSGKEGRW